MRPAGESSRERATLRRPETTLTRLASFGSLAFSIFAPKGPNKSAQGIALGAYATPRGRVRFPPSASPERAQQSNDTRDVAMLVKDPSDERSGRDPVALLRPFRAGTCVVDGFVPRAMPWADM